MKFSAFMFSPIAAMETVALPVNFFAWVKACPSRVGMNLHY